MVASCVAQAETQPDHIILVGGQAVEVWGVVFDIPSPTQASLTKDTDWLGSSRDAERLGDLLSQAGADIRLQVPEHWDQTSNSAYMTLGIDGRKLVIDFLWRIIGPANADIRRLAIPVEEGGSVIHVLHPLHCLESRLANLEQLEKKRLGNGIDQALWMLAIVEAYLNTLASTGQPKEDIAKQCRHLAQLAEYHPSGKFCFLHYGFNPVDCVSQEVLHHIGGKFQDIEWPRIMSRVQGKQAKWLAFKNRKVQHLK